MPLQGSILLTPSSVATTGAGSSASINTGGSVTFTSCASLSLNGVFTSSYINYQIVCRLQHTSSTNISLTLRLRASGTDNTTASSYSTQSIDVGSTTVSGARTAADSANIMQVSNTHQEGFVVFLFGPQLTQATGGRSISASSLNSATLYDRGFTHNQTTSYDGFTLTAASGAITGRISVIGMRK